MNEDFLAGAMQISADGAGTCIPLLVTVRVYTRNWHDRLQFLSVDPDINIYDVHSGKLIGEVEPTVEVPLPAQYPPTGCLESVYRASASDVLRTLGEVVAR